MRTTLRVRRQNISVAPLVRTTEEYPTNAFKYFPSELRSLFVCEERLCIEGGGDYNKCCGDAGTTGVEGIMEVGMEGLCSIEEGFEFRLRSKLPELDNPCLQPRRALPPL